MEALGLGKASYRIKEAERGSPYAEAKNHLVLNDLDELSSIDMLDPCSLNTSKAKRSIGCSSGEEHATGLDETGLDLSRKAHTRRTASDIKHYTGVYMMPKQTAIESGDS